MLVLALQFSKGFTGCRRIRVVHGRRHTVAAERPPKEQHSCRVTRASGLQAGRLPQNRREDKVGRVEIEWRTDPTTLELETTDPPVHQLGTGSNRVGHTPTND